MHHNILTKSINKIILHVTTIKGVLMAVDCRTPANTAEKLSKSICVTKVNSSFLKLMILGIFAGVFIGFGAQLATMTGHDMSGFFGVGITKLVMGMVFSVGLILVVIAGAELFTGNNLVIISALDKRISWGKVLNHWLIVFAANFIGSILIVYLIYYSGLWKSADHQVGAFSLKIANAKVNLSFVEALTRGILCNWLVCLAVWMAIASRYVMGKVFAIVFPVTAFVASGFEHSVANIFFIFKGILLKAEPEVVAASGLSTESLSNLNWGGFIFNNLIPVTIGNIIGGAFFVAFLYWVVYLKPQREKE